MAIIKTVEGKTPRYAGWDHLGIVCYGLLLWAYRLLIFVVIC